MHGRVPSILHFHDINNGFPNCTMTSSQRKSVVLLSGGLDSTTTLALAQRDGFDVCCLTFRYGQRHDQEINAARTIACAMGVTQHIVVDIDLSEFGGSALTDSIDVPKGNSVEDIGNEIPITYVPAHNTVFLALALAWAEVLGADDIFIGVNSLDYSGYPDCRPEFVDAFQTMANLATKRAVQGEKVTIHAPLIEWTKADIIRVGLELGIDYSVTRSCYDPLSEGVACGRCDACLLRLRGFAENQQTDPAPYAPQRS